MLRAAFASAGATEENHGQASPHMPLSIRDPFNATLVHATQLKPTLSVMHPPSCDHIQGGMPIGYGWADRTRWTRWKEV